MKSGYKKGVAICCFFALGIITGFGLLHFGGATTKNIQAANPPPALATTTEASSTSSETAGSPAPPAGYVLYRNNPYHFSFYYPPNLRVRSYNESGDALTVTLQDPATNEGFEVYVTPYTGTQITETRFKLDEPSGIIRERSDVMIDGVRATMFFGNNAIMGDTREVWFIHGDYLYEVATYKQLDTWLAQIMETWQFI